MKQTAVAKLNDFRMAPRKVRLLVDLIRGMHVDEAMVQLKFSKKHAARQIMKLVDSVVANAEHNTNLDIDTLVITKAFVDGGPILYRWMPRAFGRAAKIRKRTCHITLVVEGDEKVTKGTKESKEVGDDQKDENVEKTVKKEKTAKQ